MPRKKSANPRDLLTPAGLQILLSLGDKVRHGYGIKMEIERRTGGSLRLGPATLYEAIHRMQASGWLEVTDPPGSAPLGKGNHRKYYRLTEEGRGQLNGELRRLDEIVRFAKSRKLFTPAESS